MCAIVGVSFPADVNTAIRFVHDSLRQLQGRGQDGSGIFAEHGPGWHYRKGSGLVPDVYEASFLESPSAAAIGHNRYATQGPPSEVNLQPQLAHCRRGWIALASNGDVPRYAEYRRQLEARGVTFTSTNDGELLAWWLALAYDQIGSMPLAIQQLQQEVEGAYSVVALCGSRLYAFRDRWGFRPMVMSELPTGGVAFASEEPAFDIHRADRALYREVPAGAVIEAHHGQITIHQAGQPATANCIFELIYFARPDGHVFGRAVSLFRRRSGWRLGRLAHLADLTNAVVAAVPDSANELAAGVADTLKRPLVPALIRAHGARRTFIESEHRIRDEGVRYKLNPDPWLVAGRDIVLVDDSIVRGTTMHRIVRMLRSRGARRIFLLIGSPPVRWPCFMGIATPTKEELIANAKSIEDIRLYLEVDHLAYLPLAASIDAAGPLADWERTCFGAYLGPAVELLDQQLRQRARSFCTACFSGHYQLRLPS